MDPQERLAMTDGDIALDETIHQPIRLRMMTMLVSQPEGGRLAYGFIQKTLGLTGGNLTSHLRKLEDADYLCISKEFIESKSPDLGGGHPNRARGLRPLSLAPTSGAGVETSD